MAFVLLLRLIMTSTSPIKFFQLEALRQSRATDMVGVSECAVCHHPQGINMVSPGPTTKESGVAFAHNGNLFKSGWR